MSASPSEFNWNQHDPLARGRGEPEDAWRALCDYARRLGPNRSLEALLALYERERAREPKKADGKPEAQADLFGPIPDAPKRQGVPAPTLAILAGWFEAYAWKDRVAGWLAIQRGMAESAGASESGRMFAEVLESYRAVKEAAWAGYNASVAKGEPMGALLRVITRADDSIRKMLNLDHWARTVREDRPVDAADVVAKTVIAFALKVADVVAESAGEEAAEEFIAKVRGLMPSSREEASDDGD